MQLCMQLLGAFAGNIYFAQMKPVNELINTKENSWKNIQEIISSATNPVEVLPKDETLARNALYQVQLSTRSPIGALVYETGGLLVDNGWIRVLGSGSRQLNRNLPAWNKGKSYRQEGEAPVFLLIADDVIGGFYAINTGGIAEQEGIGSVFYFAPDTGEWENMEIGYTEFIGFCCKGDIDGFYEGSRLPGWQKTIADLSSDQVLLDQRIISVAEAWELEKPFVL
jgi:hypothetical protein